MPMKRTALPQPTKKRPSPLAALSPTGFRPAIGQTVQVTSGQLAGMRGVVIEIRNLTRCVVQLDGIAVGVLLAIDTKWLRRAPRPRS